MRCIEHGAARGRRCRCRRRPSCESCIGPPLIDAFAELGRRRPAAACLCRLPRALRDVEPRRDDGRPGHAREALAAVAAQVPVAVATTQAARVRRAAVRRGSASRRTCAAIAGPELDAPDELKAVTVVPRARRARPRARAPTPRWSATAGTTPRPPTPTASPASASCGASATRRSCAQPEPTRSSPTRPSSRPRWAVGGQTPLPAFAYGGQTPSRWKSAGAGRTRAPPPSALAARPTRRAARRPGARSPGRGPEPGPPARRRAAVEAVEEVRQVGGRRCPAPWSRTRTPVGAGADLDHAAGASGLAALSSRLLTARASRSRVPSTTAGLELRPRTRRRARAGARASTASRTSSSSRTSSALAPRLVAARELDQVGDQHAELLGLLLDVGEQPRALVGRQRARTRPAPRCSCAGR